MYVLLAYPAHSPFSKSIWMGLHHALVGLGHQCMLVPLDELLHPRFLQPRPDLLLVVHGAGLSPQLVETYKAYDILTAVHLLDEPYELTRSLTWSKYYDWVLVNDRATVRQHGDSSHALFSSLAYDPEIFNPKGPLIESEILMLGSPLDIRKEMLTDILEEYGKRITWVGKGWRHWTAYGTFVDEYVSPYSCAEYYRGASVVLNIHRDSAWSHFGMFNPDRLLATHMNPRAWEASACGALQLCTPREDIKAYTPSMPVFDTARQLKELLRWYLEDAQRRKTRADKVLEQVLPHTYADRMSKFLSQLVPA